jgi:hypothetical protein
VAPEEKLVSIGAWKRRSQSSLVPLATGPGGAEPDTRELVVEVALATIAVLKAFGIAVMASVKMVLRRKTFGQLGFPIPLNFFFPLLINGHTGMETESLTLGNIRVTNLVELETVELDG